METQSFNSTEQACYVCAAGPASRLMLAFACSSDPPLCSALYLATCIACVLTQPVRCPRLPPAAPRSAARLLPEPRLLEWRLQAGLPEEQSLPAGGAAFLAAAAVVLACCKMTYDSRSFW